MASYTSTNSWTYLKPRIGVLEDQFELFFRCSGMDEVDVEKHLKAIEMQQLQAVGVYISENGYRIAEVELRVNWKEHMDLIQIYGDMFDTDFPGWKNGAAPEAYVAVGRLAREAKSRGLRIRHWISVSKKVRDSALIHMLVCNNLGYTHGSSVEPWIRPPTEHERQVQGLLEARVTQREAL